LAWLTDTVLYTRENTTNPVRRRLTLLIPKTRDTNFHIVFYFVVIMHYFPSVSNIYYEIVHEVQKSKMKKNIKNKITNKV